MAKKTVSLQDVLAGLTNTSKAMEEAVSEKTVTRKKTDIDNIAKDIFAIDTELASLEAGTKDVIENAAELKAKRSFVARQRFATAFSNVPAAKLKDRSDEGIAALRKILEESRYGMYCSEYDNDQLPETYQNMGKEQSIRFKGGENKGMIKFGSYEPTKRTWNIATQLLGDIDKFGWHEIFKGGKVVPYKDTQKWSIDEDGNVVKEKADSASQKGNGSTPPSDGYSLIEATIKTLEQRLNRKDVDLTSKKGEELANRAMLAITKAVNAAKVKAEK